MRYWPASGYPLGIARAPEVPIGAGTARGDVGGLALIRWGGRLSRPIPHSQLVKAATAVGSLGRFTHLAERCLGPSSVPWSNAPTAHPGRARRRDGGRSARTAGAVSHRR